MKPRKLSVAVTALLCISSICNAESNQQSQPTPKVPITLVKINKGASSTRPKAPDRQIVTCAYDGEALHLSFVYSEGTVSLYVTDDTLFTSIYEFDTDGLEVSIPVGSLYGTVYIEMMTENGVTYRGCL